MIRLKYFEEADFEQLIHWSGDQPFLLQWAGTHFTYPLDKQQLASYIKGANQPQQSDRLIYKAVSTETGQAVGHISLGRIDRLHGSARVGKVLVSEKGRGKGIGEEMLWQVLKIGFDELGLHRLSLGVFDFNHAAIRCYEKSGFVKEGLLRDVRKVEGAYWSLIEMSILENEWKDQGGG